MRVFITIEASQSCGKKFRMVLGVSVLLTLVWAALRSVGLI